MGKPQKLSPESIEHFLIETQNPNSLFRELLSLNVMAEKLEGDKFVKVSSNQDLLESLNHHPFEKILIKGLRPIYPDLAKYCQTHYLNSSLVFDQSHNAAFESKSIAADSWVQDLTGGGKWIFPKTGGEYIFDFSRYHGMNNYIQNNLDKMEFETILTKQGDWLFLPAGICAFQTKESASSLLAQLILSKIFVSYSEVMDQLSTLMFDQSDKYNALTMGEAQLLFSDVDVNPKAEVTAKLAGFFAKNALLKFKIGSN